MNNLRLEHYRPRLDPWPYVIGFALGVISACVVLLLASWW